MISAPGVRQLGVLALSVGCAACGPAERPKADTTAIPLQTSPGALASRHECQASLDSARTALVTKDAEACVANLARAATFFRAEIHSAPPDTRAALSATAEEIETLVANIAKGRPRTPRDFDRAFARANAAEADLHLGRARAALMQGDHVRAGEELLMATDHLERAAKDGRLRRDSVVQTAIAHTKSLAGEMIRGMSAVPDEERRVSSEIAAAIERIVAHVYIPPEPALR
jgi:hypothetical protein